MVKLILASNSPRRKNIMKEMGLDYEVIPSNYDEKLESDDFSYDKIEDIATQKCLDVVRRVDNNSLVFAADTVVSTVIKFWANRIQKRMLIKCLRTFR